MLKFENNYLISFLREVVIVYRILTLFLLLEGTIS